MSTSASRGDAGQRRRSGAVAGRDAQRRAAQAPAQSRTSLIARKPIASSRSSKPSPRIAGIVAAAARSPIRSLSRKADAEAGAGARAARAPRQAAARARHRGDRRAARSAWPHAGTRRMPRCCASCIARRPTARARVLVITGKGGSADEETRRAQAPGAAVAGAAGIPRPGGRLRRRAIGHGGEGALYVRVRRAR